MYDHYSSDTMEEAYRAHRQEQERKRLERLATVAELTQSDKQNTL